MPGKILVKATFVLLVALLLTPKVMAQSNRTYATADWALINGKIHTMDADGTVTEAIAVDGWGAARAWRVAVPGWAVLDLPADITGEVQSSDKRLAALVAARID